MQLPARHAAARLEAAIMEIVQAIGQALVTAFEMFWEVFWPLVLGFGLSAVVQALVSHRTLARLLGGDAPRSLARATLFGIASSSCSYAAGALGRSLFPQGARFSGGLGVGTPFPKLGG